MKRRLSKTSMHLVEKISEVVSLRENGKVVLAVSGGRDSIFLVDILSNLEIPFVIAHFDHRLRSSSVEDAKFVEKLAKELNCELFIEAAGPKPEGENIEAWARERRYEFLERVRSQSNSLFICTAHHRDDQIETFLFRLLTGRLANRSGGIQKVDKARKLLRPMLDITREDINEYLTEHKLRWCEDETNLSLSRTRNKIRIELLPILEKSFNPSIREGLAEVAERLSEDELGLWERSREEAVRLKSRWDHRLFIALPSPFQWRTLNILAKWQVEELAQDLGFRKLRIFADRIVSHQGGEFELDLGSSVRVRYSAATGPEFGIYLHHSSPKRVLVEDDSQQI